MAHVAKKAGEEHVRSRARMGDHDFTTVRRVILVDARITMFCGRAASVSQLNYLR